MAIEFCRLSFAKDLFPEDCTSLNLNRKASRKQLRMLQKANKIHKKSVYQNRHFSNISNVRLFGSSVYPVDLKRDTRHHPWLCSLRTRGFRGRHRCGVTLLSGNNTTIMIQGSQITNKWMILGVPLVGCGDLSEAAHWVYFSGNKYRRGPSLQNRPPISFIFKMSCHLRSSGRSWKSSTSAGVS